MNSTSNFSENIQAEPQQHLQLELRLNNEMAESFNTYFVNGDARLVRMSVIGARGNFSIFQIQDDYFPYGIDADWSENLKEKLTYLALFEEEQLVPEPRLLFINICPSGVPPQWLHIQVLPSDTLFRSLGISSQLVDQQIERLFTSAGIPLLNAFCGVPPFIACSWAELLDGAAEGGHLRLWIQMVLEKSVAAVSTAAQS